MNWIKIRCAPRNQLVSLHMLHIYIYIFHQYHLSRSNVLLKHNVVGHFVIPFQSDNNHMIHEKFSILWLEVAKSANFTCYCL
jgi:hypothetical protein